MIDQKTLEALKEVAREGRAVNPGESADPVTVMRYELLAMIALCEWAKKYAIPKLQNAHTYACSCCESSESVKEFCEEALAQLPKEKPDASR